MKQPSLLIHVEGAVATLTMDRPDKRNAMSDGMLAEIAGFFTAPPKNVRAVILTGTAGHFCAGLDLSEHTSRSAEDVIYHSRGWHRVMEAVQFGGLPVVSALQGAVIGGGLELAAATHIRVAEPGVMFQLPEGRRGIFVGGGASVRVGRIIGADRLTEMMLTGRVYSGEEGLALGLAHYLAPTSGALEMAQDLAAKIARNPPLSNYLMIQAVAQIGDMPREGGLFTESLSAALSKSSPDAEEGLKAFLEKRQPWFR
ncbi:MAG: crotonase/enoyl-CoA hydratase family protein [Rhodobacteraceae bacterium]|nr:crotonase/enoyl-CoA hydratase family protein [Paracoccaceae bacterium]